MFCETQTESQFTSYTTAVKVFQIEDHLTNKNLLTDLSASQHPQNSSTGVSESHCEWSMFHRPGSDQISVL